MIKVFVNNERCDELFTLSHFPGGEPHVKLNRSYANIGDKIDIILKGSDLHEYAQVVMMVNLLEELSVAPGVFVPYLAGARADKDKTKGWAVYATFAVNYPGLTVADIHSNANKEFLSSMKNIPPSRIIPDEVRDQYDVIVAPDSGAADRAALVSGYGQPVLYMNKVRDQDTGRIIKYGFGSGPQPSIAKKKLLVVDDICDGGMTFKLLADKLDEHRVGQLDLYVTHGIFSGNAKENLSPYNNIYTTNSLESATNVDATIIDLERIYLENSGPIPD